MTRDVRQLPRPAVAPSLLAADFARLADEIAAVEAAGAHLLHLDVMDGHFVPNLGIGVAVVERIRPVTALPLDVHLMVERPEAFLLPFARAGADHLTFHVEATADAPRLTDRIHELGCSAGVASNPESSVEGLLDVLPRVDLVLAMTVHPGFGGQRFLAGPLDKVRALRRRMDPSQRLAVDGGVDPSTAARAREAGADLLVAGTAIFRSPSYREAIEGIAGGPARATTAR